MSEFRSDSGPKASQSSFLMSELSAEILLLWFNNMKTSQGLYQYKYKARKLNSSTLKSQDGSSSFTVGMLTSCRSTGPNGSSLVSLVHKTDSQSSTGLIQKCSWILQSTFSVFSLLCSVIKCRETWGVSLFSVGLMVHTDPVFLICFSSAAVYVSLERSRKVCSCATTVSLNTWRVL